MRNPRDPWVRGPIARIMGAIARTCGPIGTYKGLCSTNSGPYRTIYGPLSCVYGGRGGKISCGTHFFKVFLNNFNIRPHLKGPNGGILRYNSTFYWWICSI